MQNWEISHTFRKNAIKMMAESHASWLKKERLEDDQASIQV